MLRVLIELNELQIGWLLGAACPDHGQLGLNLTCGCPKPLATSPKSSTWPWGCMNSPELGPAAAGRCASRWVAGWGCAGQRRVAVLAKGCEVEQTVSALLLRVMRIACANCSRVASWPSCQGLMAGGVVGESDGKFSTQTW